MRTGILLLIIGTALLVAEAWVATFAPVLGITCLVLTGATLAVIASEVRQDRQGA